MILRDAGHREISFAQKLIQEKRVHPGVDLEFMLSHGVYDASKDVICLTAQGVAYKYSVE